MDEVERMDLCRSVYKKYIEKRSAQVLMTTTKTNSDIWDKHMKDLSIYKDNNGHCRVPRHYPDNPKLGRWVMNVRSHFQLLQRGKKSSLVTDARLKQLQDIDFEFSPKTKSHTKYYIDRWEHHLKELYRFKERHGHCRVPQRFTDNKRLGGWVLYVRHQYRKHLSGKSNTLTGERINQLMEVGFDFEPRKGRPGR
jgi:Helicase associated domain